MFKSVRILQAGAILLLLAGCGSTRTAELAQAGAAPSPAIHAASTGPTANTGTVAPLAATAPAPSIKAGSSVVGSQGFLDVNGSLTPAIQAYVLEVAQSRHVPLALATRILESAQFNPTVARLMAPAKTRIKRSWVTYRNRFVEPVRINGGVKFWNANRAMLDATAKKYGVPASIIVAIIGIETLYGQQTGDFRVLDALATLGFRYPDDSRPERSQLFRDQLADLIQLHHEGKVDAFTAQGSFAGAMGLPQFMPGSLMRYAVDGDNDGRIDLLNNTDDAIVSVASFLRQHGWVPQLPVFAPVVLPANAGPMVAGGLFPTYDWTELQARGAKAADRGAPSPGLANVVAQAQARGNAGAAAWRGQKLGVIDLVDEPRNLSEYRTGTPNFFAITHYNRSYFYAASVADLAEELADRIGYGGPNGVNVN